MRFLSSLNLLSSPNKQVSTFDLGSESLPGFSRTDIHIYQLLLLFFMKIKIPEFCLRTLWARGAIELSWTTW